jgi:hypothetical protein
LEKWMRHCHLLLDVESRSTSPMMALGTRLPPECPDL